MFHGFIFVCFWYHLNHNIIMEGDCKMGSSFSDSSKAVMID